MVRAPKAWLLYLMLGVLLASGYFLFPPTTARDHIYNVVLNTVGLATVAVVLISVRLYRPVRSLPWRLFTVGLLLLIAGDAFLTINELLGRELSFPTYSDVPYLAFYLFMIVGLLMIGSSRLARSGTAGVIDPLIVATGFGLLFWVYLMEPYIVEAYAGHPSITPVSVLIAMAYPLMDLLLFVVVIRTLVISSNRPVSYYLLGGAFGALLISDVVWTVAQAMGSRQISNLVDLGFLLFFSLFGAAALHPSMVTLFEPVPRVEAKLTRPRLALLAGASLMAPAVLALQAARGETINVPLFVVGSAMLFLLVVARLASMMRAREKAADRERVLRQAGAALAASQSRENLREVALDAALKLLGSSPTAEVGLWMGSTAETEGAATSGESASTSPDVGRMTDTPRDRLWTKQLRREDPAESALPQEALGDRSGTNEVFVVPLRARTESKGAIVVTGEVPLSQESQNGLEALGAEVALALENLQLIDEVRRTSVLKERQRMSHEIHDTLAQGFTSIVMSLSAAQLAHPKTFSDSAPAQRHLELAQRTARESLAETRRLVWALRPEALDRHALPQALKKLVDEWSEKTDTEAHCEVTGNQHQLLPEIEVALLRIAQEALANVQKHARANRVVLTLSYSRDFVALDVSDDGVGFDPDSPKVGLQPQDAGGFGLTAMRERIEQLDGTFSVESTPGSGTTLAAELPTSRTFTGQRQQTSRRETNKEVR